MKIAVCVKPFEGELTPFDASALEEALCVTGSEVTVVSMCPPSCSDMLRRLTRLGVKRVCLISDPLYAGSDTLATAYILSKFFEKENFDAIFCGRQSSDGDTGQTGIGLAANLGYECVTGVMSVVFSDGAALVSTRTEETEARLPAVLTFERTKELRLPSIFSRLGETETLDNTVIRADASRCGLKGSPTRVVRSFERDAGRRKCKFITPDKLLPLIERLKTAPRKRVEEQAPDSGEKLGLVWAVGDEVYNKAKHIAEKCEKLKKYDVLTLERMIRASDPDAVFFGSDTYGKVTSATLQSRLRTGLCADVTSLSVEDGTLYMFRPARGGKVYAKIKCMTRPALATLRVSESRSDVIISGGRGVRDFDLIERLAERVNGTVGASRGAVDRGSAPYERQIGLTGKKASAVVYVAIGISGAVQHTCAIEDCEFVVAVNPDKSARIFDYADYGVVAASEDIEKLLSQ